MVLMLVWLFGSIGKSFRATILKAPSPDCNKPSVSASPSSVSADVPLNTTAADFTHVSPSIILPVENQEWNFPPRQDAELDNQGRSIVGAAPQYIHDRRGSVE